MRSDEFEFYGLNSRDTLGIIVGHVPKPLAPEITNQSQAIPNMYGALNQGNDYGAKIFNIPITIPASDEADYNEKLHNIASVLVRPDAGTYSFPLIFGDEPDVTYYGAFTQIPEPSFLSETVWDSQLTLTFTCFDPKGYMDEQEITVTDEPFSFTPEGTGPSYPIYRITPKKDVYEVGLAYGSDPHSYVDIGYSVDADDSANIAEKEPKVASDDCNTLATWHNLTTAPFDIAGDIAGSFMSNETSISVYRKDNDAANPYDYGNQKTQYKSWHGPFLAHEALSQSLKNFDLSFRLHHEKNYHRAMSKAEVYLGSSTQKCVGRFYIQDRAGGGSTAAHCFIGPTGNETKLYEGQHGYKTKKDTYDYITVTRKGKHYVYKGKGKKKKKVLETYYYPHKVKIKDVESTSDFNKTFLQFHIRKIGLTVWFDLYECNLKTGKTTKKILNKKITLKSSQDFDLSTIYFHPAKHNITEDTLNAKTGNVNKVYNYGWNSITAYSVKEIIDGGNTEEPHIIAKAGDTIVIDCESNTASLIEGASNKSLENRISFGSTFPPLQGGQEEAIAISPGADEADISFIYRPTYL